MARPLDALARSPPRGVAWTGETRPVGDRTGPGPRGFSRGTRLILWIQNGQVFDLTKSTSWESVWQGQGVLSWES